MELDLHQLIRIARRRWWIVVLLTLVTGSLSYYNVSREIPMYQTSATMVVNPGAITGSGGNTTSLYDSMNLIDTYVQLINTQPVTERAQAILGEDHPMAGVSASSSGSLLIYVTAYSDDPQVAADTANAYVQAFQEYIADQNAERIANSRSAVDAQIAYLQSQVDDIDTKLPTASDTERSSLQQQRQSLISQISQLQSNAAQSEMQASSASAFVQGVDSAYVPSFPYSPNVRQSTMLGAFVGILLAVGVVALLEFLDNTVKSYTNVQEITHAPLLTSIPVSTGIEAGSRQVYTITDPKAAPAEAVRLLRTNLTFAGVDHPIDSLAITSSLASEGKSTISSNLAVAAASSGLAVALIDADLRKPTLHRIFGIDNSRGVSTFIANQGETWEAISSRVALPGLTVMPSGPVPPNPSEMLVSPRFKQLIEKLESEFDLVIIDTPPVLQASDALIVGDITDGVLLVTRHGSTRIDALRNAAGMIHQSGTRLVGVVVNRVDKSGGSYYGGGYYGKYYGSHE
ncbi:MAG: polysaccharide biosynthesis tyrosine autokinase [Thermomicrobiales bacterium]|nr:polysaccharide biosynthesis tyrosine autokinase [Thermomicrobiales bacterium]